MRPKRTGAGVVRGLAESFVPAASSPDYKTNCSNGMSIYKDFTG